MEMPIDRRPKGFLAQLFGPRRLPINNQQYLLGVRGLFVVEAFAWVFLQTFVPTTVKGTSNTEGPAYQVLLRKSLSVLFWNESLIYSAIILLSGRTVCIPFLESPSKISIASASFRRGVRLWFPVAVALAIVKTTFSITGTDYIDHFKEATVNTSFQTPYTLYDTLAYFNSVFDIFWTTFNFSTQAGSQAFPSQTLWIVTVIYAQSYTVYMTMLLIPYTRSRWRVEAGVIFVLTAWWVQSWAWYTITGLLLADAVMNMDFKKKAKRGIPIWRTPMRCPLFLIYSVLVGAGLTMQYLWVAWRPAIGNIELTGHTGLYYTGGWNTDYSLIQPQARDDNYLVLLGLFLLVESSDLTQWLLSNALFVYLGSRSLSYFLLQSTIIYTAGIKLFLQLSMERYHLSFPVAVTCSLLVCLGILIPGAEVFHRMVDRPSKNLGHILFDWIID